MHGEKKHWRLPNPFRRLSRPKSKPGRISSVYLPDNNSTSGFIVAPEFDDLRPAVHEDSDHCGSPPPPTLCPVLPLVSSRIDNRLGPPYDALAPNPSWDGHGDLPQRLSSAYKHIHSMPFAASPSISLSSDPQVLRKQLGVPQHSVHNYPIHSYPDLPNPHTLLQLPSPDESHTRSSKRRTDTNVSYPRRGQLGPSQRVQRKFITTPYVFKPRLSIPNISKLVKRRAEEPIITPSSLPSSSRAFRAVLRKPAADTPPSTNVHEWQISLPQVRPTSPFKVNIPLHHPWHDRRINFNSSSKCHPKLAKFEETSSQRTSENTEVLASLAWIGTPPMRPGSYTNRRRHLQSPVFLDRLTVATVVEDDSLTDDALVDRLEKVRSISTPGRDILLSRSPDSASLSEEEEDGRKLLRTAYQSPLSRIRDQPTKERLLSKSVVTPDTTSDSEDAEVWHAARKALLCIREIVRTEKTYQEAIKMLLNAQTATPPPPSMVPYIFALVRTSETLLRSFLEDPSAWGVSTAFVTSEDELEVTMVSWCAVAGAFFMDRNDPQSSGLIGKWRHRKFSVPSPSSESSLTQQTSVSLSPRQPPVLPTISATGKMKEEPDALQPDSSEQERRSIFHSLQQPDSMKNQTLTSQPPRRKLSVRDLAIQPIQRVMRYVLLYRDLLDCTPSTSPSRLLVERAVEAATRIANHCDSAQRNPAFFQAC